MLGSLSGAYNSSAHKHKYLGPLQGSPRKEKRIWSWRGDRRIWAGRFFASIDFFSGAQLPFRVAGGVEGVEEAWGEVAHSI